MKIFVEIAPVIQGEGMLVGVPHLMVRTTGCNLRCEWCDTPYTSIKPEKGIYDLTDVEEALKKFPQIRHTFLTGGNPTMYRKLFLETIALLKKYEHHITVEDNGTIFIPNAGVDLMSISPKMANSIPSVEFIGEKLRKRHIDIISNYEPYRQWIRDSNYQLKFVIQSDNDIDDALRLVDAIGADRRKVYFMPEGVTNEELTPRRQWLAQSCISLGVNYTDRLHVIIFGNTRNT